LSIEIVLSEFKEVELNRFILQVLTAHCLLYYSSLGALNKPDQFLHLFRTSNLISDSLEGLSSVQLGRQQEMKGMVERSD
jgi:hypothetical protein